MAAAELLPLDASALPDLATESAAAPLDSASAHVEWRHVSDYVDRFAPPSADVLHSGYRRARHHRQFRVSLTSWLAGGIFIEMVIAVALSAAAGKASRVSNALDKQHDAALESIARSNAEVAVMKSTADISGWAQQLGYRPVQSSDFDVVTPPPDAPASNNHLTAGSTP